MTARKDFKRLVRARMQKTGESYTSSRAQLLDEPRLRIGAPARASISAPVDFAALAGMSDAAIKAKTGCPWASWVKALDYAKADTWTHREIAAYVQKQYKVSDWWSQTVTVGYERIKGLRLIGQRRNGRFEATKTKTFAAPVSRLYQAFADVRIRGRWLPETGFQVRTSRRDKRIRMTWPDGSSVEALFIGKGKGKSQIAIQHSRLKEQSASTRMKTFWAERLDALGGVLSHS